MSGTPGRLGPLRVRASRPWAPGAGAGPGGGWGAPGAGTWGDGEEVGEEAAYLKVSDLSPSRI